MFLKLKSIIAESEFRWMMFSKEKTLLHKLLQTADLTETGMSKNGVCEPDSDNTSRVTWITEAMLLLSCAEEYEKHLKVINQSMTKSNDSEEEDDDGSVEIFEYDYDEYEI